MTRWLYGFEVRLVNSVLLIFCFFLSSAFAKNDTLEILMLGDSLTAGYGLPSNLTIPKLLERKIKSDVARGEGENPHRVGGERGANTAQ